MSDTPFHYSGPVTIDGVTYPDARLREDGPPGGLESWSGFLSFHIQSKPAGFTPPDMTRTEPTELRLADGRTGQAFVFPSFNGTVWTLKITGTGPAPA